ncbi:MAG TPA: FKBP-type peptidyl-prolyl cis-trans isomerase [Sphingomicrobium sp.]|nr:FKBP-type peptidyl-prolyl cis-trans isomerase [Sphingomicrobium sp.]
MSVSTLYHPPHHKAALAKFWLAVLFLVTVGVGLAWLGASPLRGETTASGLVFRTIEAGSGPVITSEDAVLIDYEGRLTDGTVFDSSAASGGPQALAPAQTIPGFAEALTRMRKGGSYRILIPSNLAYGSEPRPGIPANSDLEFDIHVVDVARGAAAMAARAAPQQQQQQQPQPATE